MNKPTSLLNEYYCMGIGPGMLSVHTESARFQPQEAVHMELLLNVPCCLDK